MNEPRPDRPDHPVVRQLVEVLRLRQAEAPTPARAGVLEELAADEPLQLVEAIERSSLGAPEARVINTRCLAHGADDGAFDRLIRFAKSR